MTTRWLRNPRCMILLCAMLCAYVLQARTYVVAVGVSDYPGVVNDLKLSAGDARSIADFYNKVVDTEVYTLYNQNATVAGIRQLMSSAFSKAGTNDRVLFYFSGHGIPGGFMAYDGPVTYDVLSKTMSATPCRHKMIFADACFSGKIRKKKTGKSASSSNDNSDVMLFLSSRGNETSLERPTLENSVFTLFLLKGLKGKADADGDRVITAKELFKYVNSGVRKLTKEKQHPVMWGKFPAGMPIIKW